MLSVHGIWRTIVLAISLATAFVTSPRAHDTSDPRSQDLGGCRQWPLRDELAVDGDTVLFTAPELPVVLQRMSARLLNIDSPELRASCISEAVLAEAAREELRRVLSSAREVIICPVKWDKYGGRIDATVWADGIDVGEHLVRLGLARPYVGGDARESWCE